MSKCRFADPATDRPNILRGKTHPRLAGFGFVISPSRNRIAPPHIGLPCCFWTPAARLFPSRRPPLAFFLLDAAAHRLRPLLDAPCFWTRLAPGDAPRAWTRPCALTSVPCLFPLARSLQYNSLDDDAKRAITAVQRPGLAVQL